MSFSHVDKCDFARIVRPREVRVRLGVSRAKFADMVAKCQFPKDTDGDEISSCAVGPDTGAIFRKPEPSGKNQKAALATIRRSLSTSSSFGHAGCGSQTQCLKVEDAITLVAATLTITPPNKRTNEARRLVGDLTKGNKHLQSAIDAAGEAWLWQ